MAERAVTFRFKAVNAARGATQEVQRGLRGLRRETDLASVANRRFSQSLGGSSWRRQVQQAGMQVSDFAVQVAGGQSAILAFTQNAPQFIQNFGAMGGVLAAAVTILGTVAFSFQRARGAAKEFGKQIEDTTGTLDHYFSMIEQRGGAAAKYFSEAKSSLQFTSQAAKDLLAIAKIEAFESVRTLATSLSDAATEAGLLNKAMLGTDIGAAGEILGINTVLSGNITMWKDAREQVQMFIDSVRGISEAASIDQMYESAVRARDIFKSHVDVTGELTSAQRETWKQISQTIQQLEFLGAAQKATSGVAEAENSRAAYAQYYQSRIVGEQLAARAAADAAEKSRAAHGQYYRSRIAGEILAARWIEVSIDRARQLAGVSESITFSKPIAAARQLAKEISVSVHQAMVLMGIVGQAAQMKRDAASPVFDPRDPRYDPEKAAYAARLDRTRRLMENLPTTTRVAAVALPEVPGGGGGSRGGGSRGGASATQQLTEAQQKLKSFKESMVEMHPALRDMLKGVSESTLEVAEKIKSNFETLQRTISDTLMSSFKGLLDGSKSFADATRDILSSIANKVIDILMTPIFNRWAGNIAGGILGGLGGAGLVPSFEGGGMTGAGVRAGGLDGKGGKLAMVHPDEEVVDYRNGGSRGGVTVNQYITTPDAESMKRSSRQIARRAKQAFGG